jgi:hypothetical protein
MPTLFFAMVVQKWHTPEADPGFQVRGSALKKNCAERREARKCLWYFVWKITILRKKNHFFPILGEGGGGGGGGGAPGAPLLDSLLHTTIKVMNSFLIRVAWVSRNASLFLKIITFDKYTFFSENFVKHSWNKAWYLACKCFSFSVTFFSFHKLTDFFLQALL